jgi:Asp-tRNA(Asn)/Glu-tRNA(Gln) amidotransferase A subunit family amidase
LNSKRRTEGKNMEDPHLKKMLKYGDTEAGEPVGITFTGTAYSEPLLIEVAYAYEQMTKFRNRPVLEKE